MDLKATKERIRREKRFGDVKTACRKARVSDASVFRNAMRVDNYENLTPGQERVLNAMIVILDSRVKIRKKLTSC
jgi:hypothetical protein